MNHISQWVAKLADGDATVRQKARERLIHLEEHEATWALVKALTDPRTHVRWEAAKALLAIADPVSAPELMRALDDDDEDVRWVAAEGLIALGKVGLLTVLTGLITHASSVAYCKSAHHVLHELPGYASVVKPVLEALDTMDCAIAAPLAAFNALIVLSRTPDGG